MKKHSSHYSRGANSPLTKTTALGSAVAAALLLAPMGSQAQETVIGQLEEIVVTAQRREQSLDDVPISVAAYSQEKMDVQGIRNINDIASFTPSVRFEEGDGLRTLNPRISIRGVSSNVGGATTGIYIDDTPIAIRTLRTNGDPNGSAFPRLFDIDRVEVLRGPQGTLFGSGSEGGTVRFITPEPSLSGTSVYARSGASFTEDGAPSWEAGIAGGTPIIEDKLGLRVSIQSSETGGYVDHGDYYTGKIDDEDYNSQEAFSLRVALKWLVTEDLTVSPSYYHQEITADGDGSFYLPDDNTNINRAALASYYARYGGQFKNYGHFGDGVGDGNYVTAQRVKGSSKQFMDLYAVKFQYALPGVDLIYTPSVYEQEQKNTTDFSFLNFGVLPFFVGGSPVRFPSDPAAKAPEYDRNENRAVTHEFRVQSSNPDSRISWVLGAFMNDQDLYSQSKVDSSEWGRILPDAVPGFVPAMFGCANTANCVPPWVYFYQGIYSVYLDTWGWDKEKAVFGQADVKITDKLSATLGLRYSEMSFESKLWSAGAFDGPPIVEQKKSKTNMTSPKVGLQYSFDDDKMVYATAAKGGRNGGVNQLISDPACLQRLRDVWGMPNGAPVGYDPDTVWSYELGTKFQLQQTFSVNAAIYQINWKDIIRNVPIGGDQCIFSVTTNLGEAQSRGAELEVQYYPVDSLLLSATAGYAKVESSESIPVPDPTHPTGIQHNQAGVPQYITRDGAVLPGSNTTVNLAAQYSFTAFENASYARADFRYVGTPSKGDEWDPNSSQFPGNTNMLFETPKVKTVNLRVGTQISDWDISLFINNLTNTQPIDKTRVNAGLPWMTGTLLTRPREMGFTAVYRY